MANEIRTRQNFLGGLIEDNPLSSGATTLTSTALAAMSAVGSTQHMPITLDPDGVGGDPEIVWITAHTAGATTATISRAQEGTTARAHNRDTPWVHGPTALDVTPTVVGVRVSRVTALTLPHNTWTSMPWVEEDWDTHLFHDNSTNNTRLTVPTGLGGKYQVNAQHFFAGNASGTNRYARVIKNGSTSAPYPAYALHTTMGGASVYFNLTSVLSLVAGDYLELQGLQDSGSSLDVANSGSSWMVLTRLGD